MSKNAPPVCGTMNAVRRHRRRNEPLDDDCRRAQAEWQAEYRKDDWAREQHRRRVRARNQAMTQLRARHDEEYKTLYRDILADMLRQEREEKS